MKEINFERFNNYLYHKVKAVLFYQRTKNEQLEEERSRNSKHGKHKSVDLKTNLENKEIILGNLNMDISSIITPSNSNKDKYSNLSHSVNGSDITINSQVVNKFYKNQVRVYSK